MQVGEEQFNKLSSNKIIRIYFVKDLIKQEPSFLIIHEKNYHWQTHQSQCVKLF